MLLMTDIHSLKPHNGAGPCPPMRLDCGRYVSIDSFDYSRTYAGLTVGVPNARINDRILASAINSCERSWGKRKLHVIPPVVDLHRGPEYAILPPVLLRTWLQCSVPVGLGSEGSELVVIWFSEECQHESIE
jgi:hypothetical protein